MDLRSLEALDTAGTGLRIDFVRRGPRWGHQISVLAQGRGVPLLESVEGDDQQPFPPSPPLQQLVIEPRPGGVPVAMSVGMAGTSHWSVCVEALAATLTLRLDIACRCSSDGHRLMSTYLPVARWQKSVDSASLYATVDQLECRLVPQGLEKNEAEALLLDDKVIVRPTTLGGGRTVRWCYDIVLSPPADGA